MLSFVFQPGSGGEATAAYLKSSIHKKRLKEFVQGIWVLSIGLNENYISNIERKNSFPSMTVFFYICDFFDITPAMFFDMDSKNPIKLQKIFEKMKSLNDKQLENLDFIVDEMKK